MEKSVSKKKLNKIIDNKIDLFLSKVEEKDFKYVIKGFQIGVKDVFEMKPIDQQRVASIGALLWLKSEISNCEENIK